MDHYAGYTFGRIISIIIPASLQQLKCLIPHVSGRGHAAPLDMNQMKVIKCKILYFWTLDECML